MICENNTFLREKRFNINAFAGKEVGGKPNLKAPVSGDELKLDARLHETKGAEDDISISE